MKRMRIRDWRKKGSCRRGGGGGRRRRGGFNNRRRPLGNSVAEEFVKCASDEGEFHSAYKCQDCASYISVRMVNNNMAFYACTYAFRYNEEVRGLRLEVCGGGIEAIDVAETIKSMSIDWNPQLQRMEDNTLSMRNREGHLWREVTVKIIAENRQV